MLRVAAAAGHIVVAGLKRGYLMGTMLIWIGRSAGIVGLALFGLAVEARLAGMYWIRGFQVGTVLQAGMACMLVACLGYVAALAETSKR